MFHGTEMLDGWQGWWTSAIFDESANEFAWAHDGGRDIIPKDHPHWGFKRQPVKDTCVWVIQISLYNATWGNYDCLERTGYICEIDLTG